MGLQEHFPGVLIFSRPGARPRFPSAILGGSRHGKYLTLHLERDQDLYVHLRMTGTFYFRGAKDTRQPHTHVEFRLDSGEILAYRDARRFGRLWWIDKRSECRIPIAGLGPDALGIELENFLNCMSKSKRMMKPLLLDQTVIAGLGNIYVDEVLFRARIHPMTLSNRVSKKKWTAVWESCREVLETAVSQGGSSIRDYVDSNGEFGSFQDSHQVYGRDGTPCSRCGATLRKIVVAQRGTHFCPKCQLRRG